MATGRPSALRFELPPLDPRPILARMAAYLIGSIHDRAFRKGVPGRDSYGYRFYPLEQNYAWYKSGTRPYVSEESKAKAMRKRARSGKPGRGPLVNVFGLKTRLAPRSNVPDQRLSDHTARALGVVAAGQTSITIGFRGYKAQRVARFLERRNSFFRASPLEEERLREMALEGFREHLKNFRITGRITLKASLGRRGTVLS